MSKIKISILSVLFLMIPVINYGQLLDIYNLVEIEKYQGKTFVFEGKMFYENEITNNSFAVLMAQSIDEKGKPMKKALYNDNAGDYHKKADWSYYELTGKIDKKAKYLAVGITISNKGSYYLDDFKLFVIDGKNKIELPLLNSDFENDSLTNWMVYNLDENTKLTLSTQKVFSGKQSLFVDNSNVTPLPTFGNNPEFGKYVEVNGVNLYYEIYGEGEPLLLIHGNNSSMESFREQIDILSEKYKVIGLDSRGQGKSSSDRTKITYELMAEDVNLFLEKLQLKNVNILGWSDGGNIAVILGMEHPDKVKKMAIMGTVLYNNDSSVNREINKLLHKQVEEMKNKGIVETNMDYRLKMLLLTEPNINPDSLQKIQAPTLVMAGQYDVVKEKHTKLIAEKIPNSKLVIFKGGDHEAPTNMPELFNKTILDFFN